MTTGRINQVATVGGRSNRRQAATGPPGSLAPAHRENDRSAEPENGARVVLLENTTGLLHETSMATEPQNARPETGNPGYEAVFSRLPSTHCGVGILETVKLLQRLDALHSVSGLDRPTPKRRRLILRTRLPDARPTGPLRAPAERRRSRADPRMPLKLRQIEQCSTAECCFTYIGRTSQAAIRCFI